MAVKTVRVYSTPTCPYCRTAKKFLAENGIQFQDLDVSKNKEALHEMIHKSGQMGVPVIDIDGNIMVGYDEESLKEKLGIKPKG